MLLESGSREAKATEMAALRKAIQQPTEEQLYSGCRPCRFAERCSLLSAVALVSAAVLLRAVALISCVVLLSAVA